MHFQRTQSHLGIIFFPSDDEINAHDNEDGLRSSAHFRCIDGAYWLLQTPSKSLATLVSEHVFVKVKQMVLDISMPEVCQTAWFLLNVFTWFCVFLL